jgi:hypothetical protein
MNKHSSSTHPQAFSAIAPTPPAIPSLMSLYHIDSTIGRAGFITLFALVAAAGFYWVSQPVIRKVYLNNIAPGRRGWL